MKKVSRGPMFTISVEVNEYRLESLKKTPEIIQAAMQVGADYWHTKILPEHFKKSAESKYDYAARSRFYLKNRGKGTKPSLVFSGGMRRDLLERASFKSERTSLQLVMSARVLNFVPRMSENSSDYYVRHRDGRNYPNMKREIKAITDEEREAIAAVITAQLEMSYAHSPQDKSNFRLFP